MDVSAFWKIINDARSNATDDEDFLTRIDSRVRMLEPGELLVFQRHFNKIQTESYSWNLWGAAFLMNGGCSDDGLPKARPIAFSDSPGFQRSHNSVFSAAVNPL